MVKRPRSEVISAGLLQPQAPQSAKGINTVVYQYPIPGRTGKETLFSNGVTSGCAVHERFVVGSCKIRMKIES